MKTNAFCVILSAAVLALTASVVPAANNPVWTCNVPATGLNSASSQLAMIVSDSPSSTLAVIYHRDAGFNMAGTQLVLIGAHGQVLASEDFPPVNIMTPVTFQPLSVTPRKVIVLASGLGTNAYTLQQGTVTATKHIALSLLPYASATETVKVPDGIGEYAHKTLFTTTSIANEIVEIRRYSVAKMKP